MWPIQPKWVGPPCSAPHWHIDSFVLFRALHNFYRLLTNLPKMTPSKYIFNVSMCIMERKRKSDRQADRQMSKHTHSVADPGFCHPRFRFLNTPLFFPQNICMKINKMSKCIRYLPENMLPHFWGVGWGYRHLPPSANPVSCVYVTIYH